MDTTTSPQVYCPKCGSTQLSANKKGWTLTTGLIGSNNLVITCLNCGKKFKPGEGRNTPMAAIQSKLVWDERLKKHVANPNYNGEVKTISMPVLIAAIVIIAIIIYLFTK